MIKPKEIQQSSKPKSESEVSLKPAENTAETASEKTQSTPSVPKVSEQEVQEAVNEPWAADNKIVDDRLDDNANDLVKKVRKEVEASVTRGESADKMVDAISKELEADRKRVERIVRTETAAIQNKASIDAYKGLGVDKIQVLGTLDRVTCEKCGSFDGKIFEIDKVQQGLNIPPFHPNCRCTTVPYDEDWDYKGQRIAKDDNGNDYYVPEDMSYEEWKRKFVDGEKLKDLSEAKKVSGAVNGALNSESDRAIEHAERYYDSVRKMKTDINRIAENTEIKPEHIEQVKNHLFMKKHDLGDNGFRQFYPNYNIAQSWQRLIDGKDIKDEDIVLLKHEYCESRYMEKGLTQSEAHDKANKRYNYTEAIDK